MSPGLLSTLYHLLDLPLHKTTLPTDRILRRNAEQLQYNPQDVDTQLTLLQECGAGAGAGVPQGNTQFLCAIMLLEGEGSRTVLLQHVDTGLYSLELPPMHYIRDSVSPGD